jgi:hypothetical protein
MLDKRQHITLLAVQTCSPTVGYLSSTGRYKTLGHTCPVYESNEIKGCKTTKMILCIFSRDMAVIVTNTMLIPVTHHHPTVGLEFIPFRKNATQYYVNTI